MESVGTGSYSTFALELNKITNVIADKKRNRLQFRNKIESSLTWTIYTICVCRWYLFDFCIKKIDKFSSRAVCWIVVVSWVCLVLFVSVYSLNVKSVFVCVSVCATDDFESKLQFFLLLLVLVHYIAI